jgi:CRISPR type III-A-associated RAMP protein Csm4
MDGFIVRFRSDGPWRFGPDSGARDRADLILHSDAVYSAVSWAMDRLGMLDGWLAATFLHSQGPSVRFSSGFPFQDDLLFVVPPRSLWPPPASTKVRWKGARFVPLSVVRALLSQQPVDEDRWSADGPSQCLIPSDRTGGPFRSAVRSNAAIDRLSGNAEVHTTACLEFSKGAGIWVLAAFAGEEARMRWSDPVRAAFRLLADSGIGGRRTLGWGRSEMPEFTDGILPDLVLPPDTTPAPKEDDETPSAVETVYWLLSLFSPSPEDSVRWDRGNYALLTRGGRLDSRAGSGFPKRLSRMVAEGSVVFANSPVSGTAHDVAPEGFPHPVYRAGFAVAIPIPWQATT